MKRNLIIFSLLAGVAVVLVCAFQFVGKSEAPEADPQGHEVVSAAGSDVLSKRLAGANQSIAEAKPGLLDPEASGLTKQVVGESAGGASPEAAEEVLVDAFDAMTDKWLKPTKEGVKISDVSSFVKQFKAVPGKRKGECLHRALNLIPDDNVMLLAGILMDKTIEKEYVELVYNDVLNRDEDVKKPILQQIFKDREHPCWADTAWILDVTGQLPKKQ